MSVEEASRRVQAMYAGWTRSTPVEQMRREWEALFWPPKVPFQAEKVEAGGVSCLWVRAPAPRAAAPGPTVFYLHGGGYQIGACRSHAELMARLSAGTGGKVLGVDYRLAPEHKFPVALEDARTSYRWLLDQGCAPGSIAVCGDSAGGGLAIALLVALRDEGTPLPAAAATISPWVDMEASGRSYETLAHKDPITQRPMIQAMARSYLGRSGDPRHPLASPLHADLAGLPALAIHVGGNEVLLDDARALSERAAAAGVKVTLRIWDNMPHVFPLFSDLLVEGQSALGEIADFLSTYVAPGGGPITVPMPVRVSVVRKEA